MASERIKTAVLAATSWLRGNPDHHITGDLAVNPDGESCSPNDPTAECFCVLGRISKELDRPSWPTADKDFEEFLREKDLDLAIIYDKNDDGIKDLENGGYIMACNGNENRGNPDVLGYLEELVK